VSPAGSRAALYSRVSTTDQTCDNQLRVLRAYAAARGWVPTEFTDTGVSGAKDRRPQLDLLMAAARARHIDVVACVRLDRLGRSLSHLLAMAKEFEALGVDLVVTDQAGLDTTTPAGRLLFSLLGAFAAFERDITIERIRHGLARARAAGKHLGRPRIHVVDPQRLLRLLESGASMRAAARELGCHHTVAARAARELGWHKPSPVTVA
jgi:DNA invertase Pin-like site-specific DNA recombinase